MKKGTNGQELENTEKEDLKRKKNSLKGERS